MRFKLLFLIILSLRAFSAFSQGNVGVDETSPASKFAVKGNLAVGSSYTTTSAPTDGAIIQGPSGIGTSAPDASALLDLTSTSAGLLVPRMTASQRRAILSPANGLIVYDTDSASLFYYSSGWQKGIGTNSAAGRDLSGSYPNPTVSQINGNALGLTTLTPGNILFSTGLGWESKALTGDATITDTVPTLTLTTVNSNVGTYGSATQVGTFTVNAKGLITAASNTAINVSGTGSLLNVQTLTSGTSYTPTAGTTHIILVMAGGGGAGGGASATTTANNISVGGGGGAGGYLQKYMTLASGGSGTYAIAIGSAGAGVSAAAGGNGGNTTFQNGSSGTIYTAYGGTGGGYILNNSAGSGSAYANAGGAGGAVSANGDINTGGTPGETAIDLAIIGNYHLSGAGASTQFGGGGASIVQNNPTPADVSTAGNAALGYGAGGGGAYAQYNTTNQSAAGGNGGNGIIIIYEYQ